jgi:hypothetical protein
MFLHLIRNIFPNTQFLVFVETKLKQVKHENALKIVSQCHYDRTNKQQWREKPGQQREFRNKILSTLEAEKSQNNYVQTLIYWELGKWYYEVNNQLENAKKFFQHLLE